MDFFKNTSTAYAKMARPVVPKIFWARPKSNFGEHLGTKFVFNITYLFFSHVPTLQTGTNKQWQRWKYTTPAWIASARPFLTIRHLCMGLDAYFGNHTGLDKLTNRRVNCGETFY